MEIKVGTTEIQGLNAMLGCEQVVKCSILGEEYKGLMGGESCYPRDGGGREGQEEKERGP